MTAILKNGNKAILSDLRDVLYLVEETLGEDIKDCLQAEFDLLTEENKQLKNGINDISNEFDKVMESKDTFTEEQQELLEDLGKEVENNIWW